MAEEVEIRNVGGEGGVASEATLASLTRAIEKLAGATGRDPKKEAAKVQKMHTRTLQEDIKAIEDAIDKEKKKTKAVEKAIDATNRYSKAVIGAVGGLLGSLSNSVLGLSQALFNGGNNLTDFAQHFPLVGSYLTILTGIIDQNIDAFRSMSQVGATFGNGLTDIRQIAANASMPLQDFVDLVTQNSESMKLFGSSTANGARNFAVLSKELRQGPGRALMNLGFTSRELNELLLDYAEIQNIAFTRDRIQGRVTSANAAAFGEELMKITAITGKRREQIEDELRQQAGDIRVRAALGRMDEDQRERFQLNIADISSESRALGNALIDFSDGIPSNDTTRALMQFSDTFRILGQDIQNMDAGEFNNFVVGVRTDLEAFAAANNQTLDEFMAGIPGLAEAFDMVGETARRRMLSPEEIAEMEMQAAQERKNAEGLKQFGETLNIIRGDLMSAFIDSGVLGLIQGMMLSLADTLGGFVRDPAFAEGLASIVTAINDFIYNFQTFDFKTALFGNEEQGITGLFGEGGPFYNALTTAGELLGPIIGSAFSSLFEGLMPDWDTILVGAIGALAAGVGAFFIGIPSLIAAPIIGAIAAVFGYEAIESVLIDAWTGITNFFDGIKNWWNNISFSKIFDDVWNKVTSAFDFELPDIGSFLPDWMRSDETVSEREALASATNEFAGMATGGIASGPNSGYMMQLHGTEAVVPLPNGRSIPVDFSTSTASTEIPKIEIDNIAILTENIQDMKNEIVKSLNTTNQSTQDTIKQLNRLMSQLLEIMQEMAEDADNIEKNTRSMGGNIASGRISAVR